MVCDPTRPSLNEVASSAGVSSRARLVDVLDKLANGWKMDRLDELLPPNWKAGQSG